MENLNLEDFEKIIPSGGKKSPLFGYASSGYFRINSAFKKIHSLENKKAVNIKAKKEDSQILIALEFVDDKEEGSFVLSHYPRNNSATFPGRSLFFQLGLDYRDIGKIRNLKPVKKEQNGKIFFIFEISLPKK